MATIIGRHPEVENMRFYRLIIDNGLLLPVLRRDLKAWRKMSFSWGGI
jgi:hypothetical protein